MWLAQALKIVQRQRMEVRAREGITLGYVRCKAGLRRKILLPWGDVSTLEREYPARDQE